MRLLFFILMIGIIGAQVNSSVMIEEIGDWKFNQVNQYKIDISGEDIERIDIDYQNISGLSINELNITKKSENFYVGDLLIASVDKSNKGAFDIKITVFRNGESESFSKSIIIKDKKWPEKTLSFLKENLTGYYYVFIIGALTLLFILFLIASEKIARRMER